MNNIAIVDDDLALGELIHLLLKQHFCFNGFLATSFTVAAESLPQLSPSLVVLDNRLADGTGLELCRCLREKIPNTRWLLFSGYMSRLTIQTAISYGISGAVSKRSSIKEIVEATNALLAGRRYFCSICSIELAKFDKVPLTRT